MQKLFGLLLTAASCFALQNVEATIRVTEFNNNSEIKFEYLEDGTPFQEIIEQGGLRVGHEGATFVSKNGKYKIILEDAERSGFHRPHWKFNVWMESKKAFPTLENHRLLYAVFFYDDEGEMKLTLDKHGILTVEGGRDVLYPWKVGTIGRGNPYHKISHDKAEDQVIKYFDYDGFVGYPFNTYTD